MAYTKDIKIFSDALSDTYDIVDECNNVHYNMTEYYSESITNQTGAEQTEKKYISLYRGLWTLKNISLAHLPKISYIEESNGLMIVWERLYGMSVKEYVETYNTRISYKALLNVMSPLLDDCETAHQNGLYFTISPETIFLTDGGDLKLNTLVNPSASVYSANMGIARSIFYILTGFPYGNMQLPVDVYIPDPLRLLLEDVLTWRREFSGIGEFHYAIRSAIRSAEKNDSKAEQGFLRKWNMNSGVATAISIGIGCISVLMIILIFSIVNINL